MRSFALTTTLVAGLVAGTVAAQGEEVGVDEDAAQADPAQALEDVVERLNTLDTSLDDAGKRLAGQQEQLAVADRAVADRARHLHDLSARIDETEAALDELAAKRQRLDEQRQRQVEAIAEHLRDAWRFSDQDALRMLLEHEDPSTFERVIRYHGYFAKARAAEVAKLRATLDELADNERRSQEQRQALLDDQAAAQDARAGLVAERDDRRRLVQGLRIDLSNLSEQRERLLADRRRLASLVEELQRQAEEFADTGLGTEGNLPWPVDGQLFRRFGQPRAGGRMHWQGVYILAPLGSDVRAVAGGRVVFADWLRGFGLLAIVDHGGRQLSLYGYADSLYKRVGDRVEGGEVIAAVGQSGGQERVGLYFEMRQAGEPIDPQDWLQTRAAGNDGAVEGM